MTSYAQVDPSQVEYIPVAPAADVPPGERLLVEIDGEPLVVFNIAGQELNLRMFRK